MHFHRVLMIFAILACWSSTHKVKSARLIDCEKYVFHPQCRGSQARKRVMDDNNDKPRELCTCRSLTRHGRRGLLKHEKILEAMLANGIDINAIYDAYSTALSSKNNEDQSRDSRTIDQRTRLSSSSSADSMIDLTNSDVDMDY